MGILARQMVYVQVAQSLMVGAVMTTAAVWVLRNPRGERSRWLGAAFLVEGLVFLQYVPSLAPRLWGSPPLVNHMGYSSYFDAVAELLIALASLVALQDRIGEELRYANEELVASQERLRQLVDLDPLTSLMNRRGFRRELTRAESSGAAIIFLDINNFKSVNDRLGHSVGDGCLRRLARALTQCFRAEDALFRWGGDEFLVLAPGLDIDGAGRRVAQLCSQLGQPEGDIPRVRDRRGRRAAGARRGCHRGAARGRRPDVHRQEADGHRPCHQLLAPGAWPLVATCSRGLEEVLRAELVALGHGEAASGRGMVSFRGGLGAVYRANLWLRTRNAGCCACWPRGRPGPGRRSTSWRARCPWEEVVARGQTIAVDAAGTAPPSATRASPASS